MKSNQVNFDHHYYSDFIKNILDQDEYISLKHRLEINDSYIDYVAKKSINLFDNTVEKSEKEKISFLEAQEFILEDFKNEISQDHE
ncbi:hypothetical protein SAMN04489761_3377 [Tenacibaculum sp. MAR_2009_124]|uniref:hypothetical protein n=1 Tax=Tenacibaculum sp. MAR_2009_124 TaxID=1250059 RepID=UPI00089AF868|nr:hypothetical protein [Tenacibaculum sp. MAR_2009_124]SEC64326.1 hypothetical protein SAMN04489761_3377 [Tenacibaculum sp. MAR_2009_124]